MKMKKNLCNQKVMPLAIISAVSFFNSPMAISAPIYLNNQNINVTVGAGTSTGTFNNTFSGENTIGKVTDAPSAEAEEFHNQTTHIWFTADQTGGGLELEFDFNQEYDITTLHFWNYTGENFDVDNIDFTFFNSSNEQVGMVSVLPELGSSPGIQAEDILLEAPLNVQFVTAALTGNNGQVDFQNIGFTAELSQTSSPSTPSVPSVPSLPAIPAPSAVPVPGAVWLFGSGVIGLFGMRKKRL